MKIIIFILCWIIAIFLLLIGFKFGRESVEPKLRITNPDDITDEHMESDMELMKSIICQICDYAVDNNLPPTLTVAIVARNMFAISRETDFDGWKKK